MLLEKKSRSNAGSCNFHDGLKYDYVNGHGGFAWDHEEVFEFSREANGGIKVQICRKCLEELLTRTCMETIME